MRELRSTRAHRAPGATQGSGGPGFPLPKECNPHRKMDKIMKHAKDGGGSLGEFNPKFSHGETQQLLSLWTKQATSSTRRVWQGLWVCLNIPPEREAATPTSVHCVCLTPLMASNKKRGTHATLQGGSTVYVSSRGQGNRQMRVGKRIHGQEMKEAIYQEIGDFKKGISGSNPDRRKKEKRGQNSLISER